VKGKQKLASGKPCQESNLLKFTNRYECLEVGTETEVDLLHERLGHTNTVMIKNTMKNLNENVQLEDPKRKECICEPCVMGNSRRQPYPKTRRENPEVLQRIAADVQGPFPTKDIEGCHSNLKIVDVASGYIRIFMLPNKSSETVAKHFEDYILQMERRTGRKISLCRNRQRNRISRKL
jgi:hypothetical protein